MGSNLETPQSKGAPRSRVFLLILGGTTLLAFTSTFLILLGVGKWLIKEDSLQKAAAIVVLSGNFPDRALEAAELYREGYAPEIWLTHPAAHSDGALKVLGIRYPNETDFNRQVFRRQGIPAKAVRVLDDPIENTADELKVIRDTLRDRGEDAVIIVTNKSHTRRVHILWEKYFGSSGQIIVHGVSEDNFEPAHWWKYTGSTTQVIHEVMGIMNAWAGQPIQSNLHAPKALAALEQAADLILSDLSRASSKQTVNAAGRILAGVSPSPATRAEPPADH
jgi:uncharacterized SAM-binding protein YcdF (DUF218 family)